MLTLSNELIKNTFLNVEGGCTTLWKYHKVTPLYIEKQCDFAWQLHKLSIWRNYEERRWRCHCQQKISLMKIVPPLFSKLFMLPHKYNRQGKSQWISLFFLFLC